MPRVEGEEKCRMIVEWWKAAQKEFETGTSIPLMHGAQKLMIRHRMIGMTSQYNHCLNMYPELDEQPKH